MFRLILIVVTLWALLASTTVFAGDSIGVVDWRRAIFLTKAAKQADAEMREGNKDLLDRLKIIEGKIDSARKKLSKDKDLLSEKEQVNLKKQFDKDALEFNQLRARLQEIQIAAENEFIIGQKDRIDESMVELAKKYDLTIILDRQVVVYGQKTRDLTEELTSVLDSTP